jgi:hypothetical protein
MWDYMMDLEHLWFTAAPIILVVRLFIRQSTLQRKLQNIVSSTIPTDKHLHGTKFTLMANWPPPGQELLCPL